MGAWALGGEVARIKADPQAESCMPDPWEHQDIVLHKPKPRAPLPAAVWARATKLYFDGGSKQKQGAGGYVVYRADGSCAGGQARLYGPASNNVAEARALVDGLAFVERCGLH